MAGLGCQKRGVKIARVMKAEGGEAAEDMSAIHEETESPKEEARETKLEKKGFRETKAGKMIKDVGKGFKEGVKKISLFPKELAESIVEVSKKLKDPKFRKAAGIGQPYMGPSKKEFRKGGMVKKGMHKMSNGKMMKNSNMKKGKK
jgi:hypothetical protein